MANIGRLIEQKTTRDEAWRAERKEERESTSYMRDAALETVTSDPEQYARYLQLQGDNIQCSVGNVVLAMTQLEGATQIGSREHWHKQGRRVKDGEMSKGAKVFVPSRNENYRGYLLGDYYDVSQTTGKPIKGIAPLDEGSQRMETALATLMNYSAVDFVTDDTMQVAAYYDPENMELAVNPEYSDSEVFAALATEIAHSKFHNKGRNAGYEREDYKLDAASAGYLLCRRFGVPCEMPDVAGIGEAYEGMEASTRGTMLEQLREMARDIGNGIEKAIQPRQPERGQKRSPRGTFAR